MSVNAKMTALADAIREKTGRTDALSIDAMTTAVQSIEASGGASVETCTGRVAYDDLASFRNPVTPITYYTNANQEVANFDAKGISTEITAVKGSLLYISNTGDVSMIENATLLCSTSTGMLFSIDADQFGIMVDHI